MKLTERDITFIKAEVNRIIEAIEKLTKAVEDSNKTWNWECGPR